VNQSGTDEVENELLPRYLVMKEGIHQLVWSRLKLPHKASWQDYS
jgi:hypothetical protein